MDTMSFWDLQFNVFTAMFFLLIVLVLQIQISKVNKKLDELLNKKQ